jgi:TolA-binding protein
VSSLWSTLFALTEQMARNFIIEPAADQSDTKGMENDVLPDLSQELAEMGRGSLQRRIMRLERELKEAYDRIHDLNGQVQAYRMKEQLTKAAAGRG